MHDHSKYVQLHLFPFLYDLPLSPPKSPSQRKSSLPISFSLKFLETQMPSGFLIAKISSLFVNDNNGPFSSDNHKQEMNWMIFIIPRTLS